MKLHQKYRQRCSHCVTSYHASTTRQNPSAKTADFSCSSASVFGKSCVMLLFLQTYWTSLKIYLLRGRLMWNMTERQRLICKGLWHMLQKPAPEISAIGLNLTPYSGTSFFCRCMISNIIDSLWGRKQSMTLVVVCWHKKTGAGIWRRIYGTNFWNQFLEHMSGA